jgi:malonyl-CoA O-methyltransferase
MSSKSDTLVFRDVQRRFDHAAAHFDEVDFVHRSVADGMLGRMEPILIAAKRIVDLGCATGTASRQLRKRFKRSRLIVLDVSIEMLRKAREKQPWYAAVSALQGDAMALPLQTGSVDLVFANLLLPWIDDTPATMAEVSRVLRIGGLFVFSTLGPDSMSQLREAWAEIDDGEHVNRFADMHDIGDGLVHAGLRDPVLDTDFLVVSYRDTASLFRDLTLAGGRNSLSGRRSTLTGKGRFLRMERALRSRFHDNLLELELEIVYGHAWAAEPPLPAGEYHVDPAQIRRRPG